MSNLKQFLEDRVNLTPNKEYLIYHNEAITYESFNKNVNRSANLFSGLGIKKGDKVGIMLPNRPEFLYVWFGLAKIGGVMVPINTALKGEGLQYIINHSEARFIVSVQEFYEKLFFIKDNLTEIKGLIYVDQEPEKDRWPGINYYSFNELLLDSPAHSPSIDINEHDVASILYTSGTTGFPKGVMIPHSLYTITAHEWCLWNRLTSEDRLLTFLPLFHGNAQYFSVCGSLAINATFILLDKFSPSTFWDQARLWNATEFNYIGAVLTILYKQPEKENDADNPIRVTFGGAAPKEIWRDFERRFGVRIVEGYGLTENSVVLINPYNHGKVGSMGKPSTIADVKIFDDYDRQMPPETVGEIVSKNISGTIMKGYFKEPEKTAETMRNGWFHTGDYGKYDSEGYFYFMDRKKDYMRVKGENISSFEVEKVLNSHPKVLESAVIGVKSELSEDEVKAYIVLKENQELLPEELIQWCNNRMAYFQIPRYIEYRPSLPKTPTERVEKYKLREDGIGQAWDRVKMGIKLER